MQENPDVFLSYHGVDRPLAAQLCEHLSTHGLRVWFDRLSLRPGDAWIHGIEQGVAAARSIIVLLTRDGPLGWVRAELDLALIRSRLEPALRIVPVVIGRPTLELEGFLARYQRFSLPEDASEWHTLVTPLVETLRLEPRAREIPATSGFDVASPFPGLRSFDATRSRYFHGRDRELRHCLTGLGNGSRGHCRWIHIEGSSGAGKSSLVRAGIVPAIEHAGVRGGPRRWRTAFLRPGSRPLEALADALEVSLGQPVAPRLLEQEAGLRRLLNQRLQHSEHADEALLLIVDQLEEVFTLTSEREQQQHLDARLAEALESPAPLYLISTIRADFMPLFGELPRLVKQLHGAYRLFLDAMTPDALREAIERPALLCGLTFEGSLSQRLVADSLQAKGGLPLLSHTLRALYDRRLPGGILTHAAYDALGGVAGALARDADELLQTFDDDEREQARSLLLSLVRLGRGSEDSSRPRRKGDLVAIRGDAALRERVLLRLSGVVAENAPANAEPGARLVLIRAQSGRDENEPRVELTHEVLLRDWSTLRAWVEQDRKLLERKEEVEQLAESWSRRNRDPGLLPTGAALAFAAGDDLGESQRDYRQSLNRNAVECLACALGAAAETAKRDRRQARRFARLRTGATALLLLLGVVASALAWRATQSAAEAAAAREKAELAAAAARSLLLVALAAHSELNSIEKIALLRSAPLQVRGWEALAAALLQERRALIAQFEGHVDDISPDGRHALLRDAGRVRVSTLDGSGDTVELNDDAEFALKAVFTRDGAGVLTESLGGRLKRWNRDGSSAPTLLSDGGDAVFEAIFSADREHMFSRSEHGSRIWNQGMTAPVSLSGVPSSWGHVVFSPDARWLLSSSNSDSVARIWNTASGGAPLLLDGHTRGIMAAAFSPDGQRVATASFDSMALWQVADGTRLRVFVGHESPIAALAFSPDGKRVLTGSWDGTARLWNADGTGRPTVFKGHERAVVDVAFSPDERYFLTRSDDLTVRIWFTEGSQDPVVLRGHSDRVVLATFSPDGTRVLTASQDGTVSVWRSDGEGQPLVLSVGPRGVWSRFTPDSARVVVAVRDGSTQVWSLDGKTEPIVFNGHLDAVNVAVFSPDGKRVLTGSTDHTARVWDVQGGASRFILRGHEDEVDALAFSPDGQWVATGSADRTARMWNLSGAEPTLVLRGHEGALTSVAFLPPLLLTAATDGTLRAWHPRWQGESTVLQRFELPITTIAVRTPSRLDQDAGVPGSEIVDWATEGRRRDLATTGAAFVSSAEARSPDGKQKLLAPMGYAVAYLESEGRRPVTLVGHEGEITSVAFSHDGTRVLTGSVDGTARLWNADGSGQPIVLRGHEAGITSVAFSPDRMRALTSSRDGTARLWAIDFENALWRATPHCISPARLSELLGDTPERAQAEHDACRVRVGNRDATRTNALRPANGH